MFNKKRKHGSKSGKNQDAELNQDASELSLEEILQEFSHEEPVENAEEISAELEELIQKENSEKAPVSDETQVIPELPKQEAKPEKAPVSDETKVIPELPKKETEPKEDMASQETKVLPEIPENSEEESDQEGDTIRLGDVIRKVQEQQNADGEEDSEEPAEQPEEEQTSPLEPGWEPEYEDPMGTYVPPEPIQFRPRSKLKELKKKLVSGPEKRYYDLSEKGIGRLQISLILNLMVVVLSAGALAAYSMGRISSARLPFLVYTQVLAMLLSALLGAYRLIEGANDLLHGRFTLKTLLLVTFAACLADGLLGLKELRIPFCAAFSLEMSMAIWADINRRKTEMGQMDTMRRAVRLDSIVKTENFYEGRPGFLRGEGEVEDFMDSYQEIPKPEKILCRYSLIAMLVSAAVGIAVGVLHENVGFGVHTAAAALLASVPATAFIAMTRPGDVLEKRMHALGTVICGWKGVQGMSGPSAVPVGDEDLFPTGSVKLNGVKFFGAREPDQVIAYGTALITAEGGGLSPIFEQLLESRNGRHYDVQNLRSYDSGGLGGEVCGEPVLVGVLPFLQEMGVDMPEGTRVNQAVYVAIDGELAGVFAITYNKMRSSAAGLTTLCGYRHLTPVLTSRDFMVTERFIRAKFGVNTRRMSFPDRATRCGLAQCVPEEDAQVLALTTQPGLAPAAFAITGARALQTALRLGAVLHMAAGILGLLIVAVLGILGSVELLSPANLLLLEVAWMIPGLLITEWTRLV